MATTVREIILSALRKINVIQPGETPTDEDLQISLESLNGLIDSWSNERLMLYFVNPYEFVAEPGKQTYTLGPGGDWNTERPMTIFEAYTNYQAQIDTSVVPPVITNTQTTAALKIAQANDAQWASIPVKQLTAMFPTILYDDGNYPLRTIYLYPIPNEYQAIVLWLWRPLSIWDSLDDPIEYPPGYEKAIIYNLAVDLAPEFGKELTDNILRTASDTKMALAAINTSGQFMGHDRSITTGKAQYNWIYGDTIPIPR